MSNICKLAYTVGCVGLVCLFLAAFLQVLGFTPLCDVFGYTGLSILAVEVLLFICWSALDVWTR